MKIKKALLCVLLMTAFMSANALAADHEDYVTKGMLVGTWVAYDDDRDLRTSYTFNSDNTGLYSFFDGALDIKEYSVTFDGKYSILSYTMVAAQGQYHLTQEPVTVIYRLEYISNDEFALITNNDAVINYKRKL